MGGVSGQATDIDIQAREILRMRESIFQILAHHTAQPVETIRADCDRDFIMAPPAALEYGILDKILLHHGGEDREK
jgi:ATP-dependent Clp protease protease subunit